MSLLQLKNDKTHEDDAIAHGEDFASGSSYILWAAIVAAIVVTVSITWFLLSSRRPPVASGEAMQVWTHSVHQLSTARDANGAVGPTEQFDQVLVFSHIRVRNESDAPIVLKEIMTNVTLADGPHSSIAAGTSDYGRIFIVYPELASLHGKPLDRDTVLKPNDVLDGMVVSAFHVTKDEWTAHKDLNITLQFKYHPDLVLVPTSPITEQ